MEREGRGLKLVELSDCSGIFLSFDHLWSFNPLLFFFLLCERSTETLCEVHLLITSNISPSPHPYISLHILQWWQLIPTGTTFSDKGLLDTVISTLTLPRNPRIIEYRIDWILLLCCDNHMAPRFQQETSRNDHPSSLPNTPLKAETR